MFHGSAQTPPPPSPATTTTVDVAGAGVAKLRVFFIPFFASGHMIPMVDLAILFAGRAYVEPTVVVTPVNATLIQPSIDRAAAGGRKVNLLIYPFPAAESGLATGQENLSSVSSEESWKIYAAVDLSRDAHANLLREHRPDAVVADIPFHWTTGIAEELGVLRITFHAVGVFPQIIMNLLTEHRAQDKVSDYHEPFTVPNLPGPSVQLTRSEIPGFLKTTDHMTKAWDDLKRAQLESYGVVVNTFYELEKEYCDFFRETDCKKGWFVGPLALSYADDNEVVAERGGGSKEDKERCMKWLEKQAPQSVVFVCFGSWCYFTGEQLREIAVGLEKADKPFIWVVREGDGGGAGEEWMPEGWLERVEKKGMVIRGWAPQAAILAHPAVGSFLSHCGWNSLLESVAAGVPMLTWPLVFEQFINERLVVNMAEAGARVWDGPRSTEAAEHPLVTAEAITRAVNRFMEGGPLATAARENARKLADLAKTAVAEGGSSHKDLNDLIDGLIEMRDRRKKSG